MEMNQIYDEDLLDNGFFQHLQQHLPDLYLAAIDKSWIICVPRSGSFEGHTLSDQDLMTHVLVHIENNDYKTVSDKCISLVEKIMHLKEGFEENISIPILFSETFYTENHKKYQVLCIDRPLNFDVKDQHNVTSQAEQAEFRVNNVEEAMELLFTGAGSRLKREVDVVISYEKESLSYLNPSSTLRTLIDKIQTLYSKLLEIISKDKQLKNRIKLNPHIADNLKLAVEMYMFNAVHKNLFKLICTVMSGEDSHLNKINRNLLGIQLKELGVKQEFSQHIPKARRELINLQKYTTPYTVMMCLHRIVSALMFPPSHKQVAEEAEPLTSDVLIPLLAFLIIRSSIPNWTSLFTYATEFHFSKYNNERTSFYLSTLEAALAFVNSDELGEWQTGTLLTSPKHRNVKHKTTKLAQLFDAIMGGEIEDITHILDEDKKAGINKERKMCHPLCSCEECETLTADLLHVGANPAQQATVLSRDESGATALHQAARYNKAAIIEMLSERDAPLNATDYNGTTALHVAAQRGFQAAAMMLIDRGADVNIRDNDGNTPLHVTTANGHTVCVKALIYQCTKPCIQLNIQKRLNCELANQSKKSIDINSANEKGDTPLHIAAKWGYDEIADLLLEHGAATEARNRSGLSPIQMTSDQNIANLIQQAIERAQETIYHGFIALQTPSPSTFEVPPIVTERSQSTNRNRSTRLTETARLFLKYAADGDLEMMKHKMGWNPAEVYTSDDEDDFSELCHPLCQCRKCAPQQQRQSNLIDINSSDDFGRTALHLAAEKGHLEMVETLLQHHADVNARTDQMMSSPLHVACQQLIPNTEQTIATNSKVANQIVRLLLDSSAKVNVKDVNGRTPLHFTSQTNRIDITYLLIQRGAIVNAVNDKGNTPLHEAVKVNNYEVVKLLLESKANPTLPNKNGLTALQLAREGSLQRLLALYEPAEFQKQVVKSRTNSHDGMQSTESLSPNGSRPPVLDVDSIFCNIHMPPADVTRHVFNPERTERSTSSTNIQPTAVTATKTTTNIQPTNPQQKSPAQDNSNTIQQTDAKLGAPSNLPQQPIPNIPLDANTQQADNQTLSSITAQGLELNTQTDSDQPTGTISSKSVELSEGENSNTESADET